MNKARDLPDEWVSKLFTESIEKEASSNKLKIQKNRFQEDGKYPIIDQSVEFIAGYTDDSSKVYKGDLPIVIFGDHTRIFKYIDFPFALGADGTKILVPKKDYLNPKYFYYFLSGIKIENHGYSRHYKFLKEKKIVIPPLPTQKKIVAILEKAEQLKGWRREADELTDELLKSTFLKMFGDPVKNQKEWEKIKLMNCIEFITSGSRGWAKYYTNEGERFIRIQNVINGELDFTDVQYVKPPKNKESIRTKVKEDDLVLSITADLGRTAVVDNKTASDGAYINQHLALIRLNKKIVNPIFVSYYLISEGGKRQFEFLDQKGVKSGLNFNSVKSLDLFLPPLELQNEFAIFSEKIKQIQQYQKQRKHQIDYLFNSLMQKAFKGELKC